MVNRHAAGAALAAGSVESPVRVPARWSRKVNPAPSSSSHRLRERESWLGVCPASPRCRSVTRSASPARTRQAGSCCHCAGTSAWRGSTGTGPATSTRRTASTAAKDQTSGSLPAGDLSSASGASWRLFTVTHALPATACTCSSSPSRRIGSVPCSCSAVKPGRTARGTVISRGFPATVSSIAVSTNAGTSSVTLRKMRMHCRVGLGGCGGCGEPDDARVVRLHRAAVQEHRHRRVAVRNDEPRRHALPENPSLNVVAAGGQEDLRAARRGGHAAEVFRRGARLPATPPRGREAAAARPSGTRPRRS